MFAWSGVAWLPLRGGWHLGILPFELSNSLGIVGTLLNVAIFIGKTWLLVFVMMWVRWTLPRLRIDQVMMTCIKYLIPISCVLLLGAALTPLALNTWLPNGPRIPRNVPGAEQAVSTDKATR